MVESAWKVDITSKSSTKYVNHDVLKVGSCRHVWSTVRDNIHDSKRAQIKCKLLTGAYILQANRAAFNQYAVNATCKLCQSAPDSTAFHRRVCRIPSRKHAYIILTP